MRAGIGLIGLLLAVGIIFYVMFAAGGSGSAGQALKTGQAVKPQVEQIAGKDEQGRIATDSIKFDTGKNGIDVQSVVPGGAFEQYFGLKAGDTITMVGPLPAKDMGMDDAKAFLLQAFQQNQDLTVRRDGAELKLPQAAAVAPNHRQTPRGQLQDILKGRPDEVPTH